MIGALFAILSAVSFGVAGPFTRRGLMSGSASQAVYVTVIMGVPLFLVAALVSGEIFQASAISPRSYLLLVAAGIVHFVFGRYFAARAVSAIGANRAAPVQALTVIISVLVAVILLEEQLSAKMAFGIALIIIGPAILIERTGLFRRAPNISSKHSGSEQGQRSGSLSGSGVFSSSPSEAIASDRRKIASPPALRLAEGYFFGILTAMAWGISPIMIRSVLTDTNLSILAGMVSYTAAASVLVLSFVLPGRLASLHKMNGAAVKWFLLAGAGACAAQMFWYLALGIIPVTVAAPLQYTTPVFTFLFSFLLNRRIESFGRRVIAAIALSVVGSMVLAL